MADSSLPRYGGCDEDNAVAAARDPDGAGWRDAIAVASSPGCCRWHRMATATPLMYFTKVKIFFSHVVTRRKLREKILIKNMINLVSYVERNLNIFALEHSMSVLNGIYDSRTIDLYTGLRASIVT